MTTEKTIDIIIYGVTLLLFVGMFIFLGKEFFSFTPKKIHPYLIVYHKREAEKNGNYFTDVGFAKSEKKAKAAAREELSGSLVYNSASIYLLSPHGFITKIAEFGEIDKTEKSVQNTDDENTGR